MKRRFSRSRSILSYDYLFNRDNIVFSSIRKLLLVRKKLSLLEIGCGEGRCLLQIMKEFPQIRIFGINKKPNSTIRNNHSIIHSALYYKDLSVDEFSSEDNPTIYYYDVNKGLQFEDCSLDIIISQFSFQYLQRKDFVLEEIWRTLNINGIGLINCDMYESYYPERFNSITPRFMVYKKKKYIPLDKLITEKCKNYSNITLIKSSHLDDICYNFYLEKKCIQKLKLGLSYNSLDSINLESGRSKVWGYRSVYEM